MANIEPKGTRSEPASTLNYHINEQFRGLFRDIFNVLELSTEEPKTTKLKELIGNRLATSEEKLNNVVYFMEERKEFVKLNK